MTSNTIFCYTRFLHAFLDHHHNEMTNIIIRDRHMSVVFDMSGLVRFFDGSNRLEAISHTALLRHEYGARDA